MTASTLIILSKPAPAGRWIPPGGLIFGQLAFGASWLLLAGMALRDPAGTQWWGFAWLHLVALGWITMTALSILIHVIPAFTDAQWRFESVARGSLAVYALGVLALVAGFITGVANVLPWGGALIGAGLIAYAVPAALTLAGAFDLGKTEEAIARALGITLTFLVVTAALGVVFTWALDGRAPAASFALLPVHGELGMLGWLTILLMGVSVKTIGPIAGSRSTAKWRHVASAGAIFTGTLVLAAGSLLSVAPWLWSGFGLLALGVALYIFDVGTLLRRATVPHRAPQAFVAAALAWFAVALVLGGGVLAGLPYAKACVYVALMGWVGQMVNAHMHHIGVRLLITRFRGDDDEMRPGEVLSAPLSWTAFVLFQFAVIAGAAALLANLPALLEVAAGAGFIAWLSSIANAAQAAFHLRAAVEH